MNHGSRDIVGRFVARLFYAPGTTSALVLLVFLLALLPRLWLWDDQGRAGVVFAGDQDEYYRGAIHILLHGDYYDDGQWLRPPLTSIFFAGLFALFGTDVARALLIQSILSIAMMVVLAELARSIFRSRRAAIVAALLGALYLPYGSYASQLLSETLFITLSAAALLIFEAARRRGLPLQWLFAGGLVWGLAALTRPVGVYATPLLLLWAMRDPVAGWWAWRHTWRQGLLRAVALLAGVILVVAPWTVRNTLVYDRLVLVDTNGGVSFWLGNLLEPEERMLQFEWNETLPDSAQRQQVAFARALDNIAHDPWLFLRRMRYKTVSLWQPDIRLFAGNGPIGITLDEHSLLFAAASDVIYVSVMVLALIGIVLSRPDERSIPLLIWPLYGTLLCAVSLGHPRLRVPLMVAALVYAALPLAHPRLIWQRLRQASRRRIGVLCAMIMMFGLLIYADIYRTFLPSQAWLLVARAGGGEAAIERAIAAMPHNYLPYVALGDSRWAHGDASGALAAYDQAAHYAPQNTYVNLHRLHLRRAMGEHDAAQAAMNTIAEFGWDNNQTYVWAWKRLPAHTGTRFDVLAPAPGILHGFFPTEYDESRAFRWTMERAAIRFSAPDPPSTLVLLLRADNPNTSLEVRAGEHSVTTISVGTTWEEFHIALPPTIPPGDLVVELRAPGTLVSVAEPYVRGVALAEVWLLP